MSVVDVPAVGYGHAREALLQATVELSARVGFHAVTVAELSVAAGVGPRTFYNHFADLDDAFFEACEQMHRQLRLAIRDAYEAQVDGEVGIGDARARRCVEALLAFIEADAVRAQVLFVQSHAGGPAIMALRRETVEWLITLAEGTVVDAGADADVAVSGRGRLLAEMAVGGINEVLSSRIGAGEIDRLGEWVPWAVDTLMWPVARAR